MASKPVRATIISSRQFAKDPRAALEAAGKGPVIITCRGKPAYVLLTIDAYEALNTKLTMNSD
jgi:PHD/YefM family antitoxin component YafN of YafNO toxin-antitoxin module